MGVFVSIFTLVSVNIQAFARETISKNLIATVNLCLLTCIATLLGFVMLIVNKGKKKWFNAVYTVFLILPAASTIILALLKKLISPFNLHFFDNFLQLNMRRIYERNA